MRMLLHKAWNNRWIIRSIFKTIWFNFRYLPFNQAIKLPILLYKPHLLRCKGRIIIEGPVRFGMIKLGINKVSIYPNTGIIYENHGGTIYFKGTCYIGNNSCITVGSKATLVFGERFGASTTFKCIAYHHVIFNDYVRFGWDCIVMDTDFHKMRRNDGSFTKGYGGISIGKNNWFGLKCIIMKNTSTADYLTFTATTILKNDYTSIPPYSIVTSSQSNSIKHSGLWRDINNDEITYEV